MTEVSAVPEPSEHPDHTLTSRAVELEEIAELVVQMAAHVTEAIPRCTSALLDNDLDAAQQVIEDDDHLDSLSLELEDKCFTSLALHQPVARDLRSVTAAVRLNAEIERSGDLAVNIAKATRRMYGTRFEPALRSVIVRMSEEARKLFSLATDAYVEGDASLAAALDDIDDHLDSLNTEMIEVVFAAHENGAIDLRAAVQLALISRYYERIGDHAVNAGEQVQFIVTGWRAEHAGAARYRARIQGNPEADHGVATE